MKFRVFFTVALALCLGLFAGQSSIFVLNGVYKVATGQIKNLNFDQALDMIGSAISGAYKKNTIANADVVLQDFAEVVEGSGSDEYERFPGNDKAKPAGVISDNLEIPRTGKAIVANLENMKIDLYENGKPIQSFDILSRGRPGTAWETPPGAFEILYKKENHFSSIGKVWMPYSMQFFGNYFIHGWPYYTDGTAVPAGYSGGCIRLADLDAKEIYNFSEEGTKVIVLGDDNDNNNNLAFGTNKYQILEEGKNESIEFPELTAGAYVVADLETGEIIKAYGEKVKYPIASLSKLMTALVSLETINQYNETTVSSTAYATYGAQGDLSVGEKISIGDLIYPLLLESSNDAAEVLAEYAGRNTFMKNMNDKADSIGLGNTSFDDPSGLSPKNISTAEDLFKLTRYIFKYKSYIFDITQNKDYKLGDHTWYSNSKFKNDDYFIGGKNGFTDEAQHTLITLVELPLGENGDGESKNRKIAIVLLDAKKTEKDTRNIISYLLKSVYYSN